jgi:protein disulfide-isomerase
MKPSILAWSRLSPIIPTLAISSDTAVEKRDDNPDADNTIFNGIEVPPQLSLTPESFEETIKDGYW